MEQQTETHEISVIAVTATHVTIDGPDIERQHMTWETLAMAATQPDGDLRGKYRPIWESAVCRARRDGVATGSVHSISDRVVHHHRDMARDPNYRAMTDERDPVNVAIRERVARWRARCRALRETSRPLHDFEQRLLDRDVSEVAAGVTIDEIAAVATRETHPCAREEANDNR